MDFFIRIGTMFKIIDTSEEQISFEMGIIVMILMVLVMGIFAFMGLSIGLFLLFLAILVFVMVMSGMNLLVGCFLGSAALKLSSLALASTELNIPLSEKAVAHIESATTFFNDIPVMLMTLVLFSLLYVLTFVLGQITGSIHLFRKGE